MKIGSQADDLDLGFPLFDAEGLILENQVKLLRRCPPS